MMADAKIRITADTSQAERALGGLSNTLKSLVAISAVAGLARQFVTLADASANLQNKLSLVTVEGQKSGQLFSIVAASANRLGASLEEVGGLYFQIANNSRDLGLSQRTNLQITENLIKGFQLTGQTMAQVQGSITQLGQAFSIGTLRGDELNSVLEGLPIVAQTLAKNLGVTTGALKVLGEQGKISSQDLANAILDSGKAIDSAYLNKLPTVSQAFKVLSNTIQVLANDTNQANGITEKLSKAILILTDFIIDVADFFNKWGDEILTVIQVLATLAAFTAGGKIFGALMTSIKGVIGAFSSLGAAAASLPQTIAMTGSNIAKYISGVIPTASILLERLAVRFGFLGKALGAVGAGIASAGGAFLAYTGIEKYFKNSEVTVDSINKKLGVDQVEASNLALEAAKALSAQQVKDQAAIEKATGDRASALKDLIRDQESSLQLSKFEGAELKIQEAINAANRQLVKEIKNDKGVTIGYTQGLNAEEEKGLRLRIEQTLQNQAQRDLTQQANALKAETNRLNITDLSLREEQAAVDAKRLELGRLFTAEMEAQVRAGVKQQQANKDLLAIEQARRAMQGQQTFGEQVNRGVGISTRLDPRRGLDTEYKMDMDALKAHLDAKLISEQEYQNSLLALKQEYTNKANQLYISQVENEKAQRNTSIQAEQMRLGKTSEQAKTFADFMMKTDAEKAQFAIEQGVQVFSALGAQNKKAFEAAKAFNIANAVMNTYMAVTKALASYPFPFSLIAAGGALAFGLAQVGQIRSQQYSGRQLGGPVMGGQSYLVGENGPELFTPNTTGGITRNNDLQGGGTTNINFTIVANDAQGFDDLLLQRRGMITQMISDARLEQGMR
jgi:tape measure domain-containing protein